VLYTDTEQTLPSEPASMHKIKLMGNSVTGHGKFHNITTMTVLEALLNPLATRSIVKDGPSKWAASPSKISK